MNGAEASQLIARLSAEVGERVRALVRVAESPLAPLGAMQAYHLGWFDADLRPSAQPRDAGKRLRSVLCLLACAALAGDHRLALGVAAAIELVHNFSLVHDDIQDASPTRRGRPAVWSLWGTAQGINVGDALYTTAYRAIAEDNGLSVERRLAAVRLLAQACAELVEGQYLDLALQGGRMAGREQYEAMIGRKTGALIRASAELGALCGGGDPAALAAYRDFGRAVGQAFQYQDDLLGIWGDERVTGKSAAADIQSGKMGLPAVLAFERATAGQRAELERLYALPERDVAAVAAVRRLFGRIGVQQAAEALVAAHYADARQLLMAAPGSGEPKDLLLALLDALRRRAA